MFLNDNILISNKIKFKYVPWGLIDNMAELTAWKLLLDYVGMLVHELNTLSESNMLQGCVTITATLHQAD